LHFLRFELSPAARLQQMRALGNAVRLSPAFASSGANNEPRPIAVNQARGERVWYRRTACSDFSNISVATNVDFFV
jgi:hypothetical protein